MSSSPSQRLGASVVLRWCLSAAAACVVASSPALVHAAAPVEDREQDDELERERVLIRVVPNNKRISSRLRAELDVIGLDAIPLELPGSQPLLGNELLDQLADTDASAAIEIEITPDRVDVWVADSTTSKTLTRRFDLAINPEQAEPRTLAIAAVELLRASRLEAAAAAESDAEPADPVEPTDDPNPDRNPDPDPDPDPPTKAGIGRAASLSIGVLVGWSPGIPQSIGTTTHLSIAGRWAILEPLSLRFAARVPVIGNGVSSTIGAVRVFVSTFVVEPQWTPKLERVPWLRPALGLGIGAAVTGIIGDPADDTTDRETPVLGGLALDTHVDLAFVVHPRVWLHLESSLAIIQPAPRVLIREQMVESYIATFGLPWMSGTLAIELWI